MTGRLASCHHQPRDSVPTRVGIFGTYSATNHPRIKVLIEGFEAHGIDVVEVNAPLDSDPASRNRMTRSRWVVLRLVRRYLRQALVLVFRRLKHRTSTDVVIVPYFGLGDVFLARLLYPRTALVWDDLAPLSQILVDRSLGGRPTAVLVRTVEGLAVRCASRVMYDTDAQARAHRTVRPAHSEMIVPVGAASVWFDSARTLSEHPSQKRQELKVVYFGTYVPLHGAAVMGEALSACLRTGIPLRITLVGTGQDRGLAEGPLAEHADNVRWVDWLDEAPLARMVADADVSLGIFGVSQKARQVVPNKAYQSIAAGTPIITSDTEAQRRVLGEAAFYVAAGDADELAATLRRLHDLPALLRGARTEAVRIRDVASPARIASTFIAEMQSRK